MPPRYYRPEFDALRLLAFLAVFCYHAPISTTHLRNLHVMGSLGMSLFFVLSSYLIVTLLFRERESTGSIVIKAFFIRRMLRIWPLYFLLLFFAAVLGHFYPPAHIAGGGILSMLFLAGNFWVATHGWNLIWANPLWSLSVEEQFYLLIPLVVRRAGTMGIAISSCVVIVVSYLTLGWLSLRGALPIVEVWANSFVQFQFFAGGALLALWHRGRTVRLGPSVRLTMIVAGFCLWYFAIDVGQLNSYVPAAIWRLTSGYAGALLGTSLLFISGLDCRVKFPAFVLYLGKISYGLYMFHELFLWLFYIEGFGYRILHPTHLRMVAAVISTLLAAILSYHFFESPFLRLKYRFERVHTRAV